MSLHVDEFAVFFEEVYGYRPFPWQERLLRTIASDGKWPRVLDLPTSAGKTATIDVAVFHLALEATRQQRRAPVRIAFVVDRRLVVDDAHERAVKLAARLAAAPSSSVTARVADALKLLSFDGVPLVVKRLRGGLPREKDWARTPGQPTILCSTVDQVGSRLLFRGYGVSDGMKSLHAGLIGSDCLVLLDEAHLAEPFRQTLEWVNGYHEDRWSESGLSTPWGTVLLTATPGAVITEFSLHQDDWDHKILGQRLKARKSAILKLQASRGSNREAEVISETSQRVLEEVRSALDHFKQNGPAAPAIGIVMNRVKRARAVFALLLEEFRDAIREDRIESPILMIGPSRSLDREDLARQLAPIRTSSSSETEQRLRRPLLIVGTQCLEAGVDIDLDGLITELAPLDSLRQRFGRLNRAGRKITPYATILAFKHDIHPRYSDWVYGGALKAAWEQLEEAAEPGAEGQTVEFGVQGFSAVLTPASLAPRQDAPILLPAHLDLLSQTSPIPAADPEVALYLHGSEREQDSVTVVWRSDIVPQGIVDVRKLLHLIPPRTSEAVTLPLWAVKEWLKSPHGTSHDLADVPMAAPEERIRRKADESGRAAFRWAGDDDRSEWIDADQLRVGDTIVIPCAYGGLDEFGWNPGFNAAVVDRGDEANAPFAGRKFAVRVAGEIGSGSDLAEVITANSGGGWRALRDALLAVKLPDPTRNALLKLSEARRARVVMDTEIYGVDEKGRARGIVFIAPLGLNIDAPLEASESSTEDDLCGSLSGFALSLRQHSIDAEAIADHLGRAAGLGGGLLTDVKLAAFLHDAGKCDPRFQSWLHWGDPLGADPESILAKSARPLPRGVRTATGLPRNWRHEALSVRLASAHERFSEAADPALVLWLIGTHHGYGRPLYPHHDPAEAVPDVGPQDLAFTWDGSDWPTLFARLKKRYGVWELARLEAIVRMADHRASEMRAMEASA